MQAKQMVKETFADWKEDNAPRLGAALAYYAIFSIAPLLLIAIGVAGMVFGEAAARGELMNSLQGVVGPQGAQAIQAMVASSGQGSQGIVSTIVGFVLLLLGASGIFGQLQSALNTIWEVEPKKEGVKGLVKRRALTMGMVFAIGLLLLLSLVLSAAINVVISQLAETGIPGGPILWRMLDIGVSLLIITLFFASLFKVLPDAQIRWRDVIVGAFVTALLFVVGKFLLGLYLGNANIMSKFGPAGSLVVLLVWIYYSAQLVFLGAEFTQVWAKRHGGIKPRPHAVRVITEKRTEG